MIAYSYIIKSIYFLYRLAWNVRPSPIDNYKIQMENIIIIKFKWRTRYLALHCVIDFLA